MFLHEMIYDSEGKVKDVYNYEQLCSELKNYFGWAGEVICNVEEIRGNEDGCLFNSFYNTGDYVYFNCYHYDSDTILELQAYACNDLCEDVDYICNNEEPYKIVIHIS